MKLRETTKEALLDLWMQVIGKTGLEIRADQPKNNVVLSYRAEAFRRIKPMNKERLDKMIEKRLIKVILKSNVKEIGEKYVKLSTPGEVIEIPNDYVYIFAGGELPNEFLAKIGIQIEKRFGT